VRAVIAVLGAGAMGAAIGAHVARRNPQTVLLATPFDGAVVATWHAGEPHPALGLPLHHKVNCVPHDRWDDVLPFADTVIVALASSGLTAVLDAVVPRVRSDAIWVSVTKGWQDLTLLTPSQVLTGLLGDSRRVVAVAGPGLAPEIAVGAPTALVCAGADAEVTRRAARLLRGRALTTVVTDDVVGAETSSAFKNVVAIAVGMCEGFAQRMPERVYRSQFANARSAVFAQGLVDMVRLSQAQGGRVETVLGLAGAGDLYVTCGSGRNGRFGRLLGQGQTAEQATRAIGSTVEGIPNTAAALALGARLSVDLPTAEIVRSGLNEESNDQAGLEQLTRAFATSLTGSATAIGL
jgi:glycerol-3-phosphate dehydrogenase (NAD(P)+)